MAWRFWRRQNTERPEITPYSAAAYPVMLLLEKKPPFDLLLRLPQDPEVPEEFTGCCFIFSLAYTFVTYLILLRTQFGPELGRIVRENLGIQFNRLSNSESEGDRQLSLLFDLIVRVEDAALRAAEIHARDQEEERKIVVGDITLKP